MSDPTIKQVWAGIAMLALMLRNAYDGDESDIAADAWRMADAMEREAEERE